MVSQRLTRLTGKRVRWAMVVCVGVLGGHGLHGPAKAIESAFVAAACSEEAVAKGVYFYVVSCAS